MTALEIDAACCTGCGACIEACRFEAIKLVENHAVIDAARCRGCGDCVEVCPVGAIEAGSARSANDNTSPNRNRAEKLKKGVRTMPGFNGTGPRGMGAMTGGGRGFCNPRGMGVGYGFRAGGYGNRPYGGRRFIYQTAPSPVVTREQELQALRSQSEMLQQDMAGIDARIRELEKNEK